MSRRMLEWAHRRLDEDEDVIVPLRALWRQWRAGEGRISFDRFASAVLRDPRFEQLYSVDHDPALEAFGCFAGPRVKLRGRPITPETVLRLLRKHNERLANVLQEARRSSRSEGGGEDPPDNDALAEAALMLDELRPVFKFWKRVPPGGSLGSDEKPPA